MERVWPATHCPLTERTDSSVIRSLDFTGIEFERGGFYWVYPEAEKKVLVVTDELFKNQELWMEHKREIEYLIFNDLWPRKFRMVDSEMLIALIASSGIPSNPLEKVDEILYYLKRHSDYLGQYFLIREDWEYHFPFRKKIGVDNQDEITNLINEALERGWIKEEDSQSSDVKIALTLDGWERASRVVKISESKIAFIAMSFDTEMIQVYIDWIEPAIRESGFEPHIVLDQDLESDVTINDAILAGIKKARFTIADFTHHKSGVYFEAGYSLGRGQKVIYTCQEDHIGTAHFDTRNYQHLVWKDGADLKRKLMDKIEVFIKV